MLWLPMRDAALEGFRSGVMDRLGLGYEKLSAANPQLIYCSSTGFGPEGPYADRPAYDPLIQALSGWASGQKVGDDPTLIRAMAADKIGAYNNAQAIMAALLQRANTGRGCHVQTSMLDANLQFVWPDTMMHCTLQDEDAEHRPNLLHSYRLYTAADGWVSIATGTDAQWAAFCEALERPEFATDPRFATTSERAGNIAEWYAVIDTVTSAFNAEEVVRRLIAADVPAAPVHDPEAVFDDPHVGATGMVQESEHPLLGRFRHPQSRASQFGVDLPLSPAPTWGQHTKELMMEHGFSEETIAQALAEGAVKAWKIGISMFSTAGSLPPATLATAIEDRQLDGLYVPEHSHIPVSRETPWPGSPPGQNLPLPDYYTRTNDQIVALAMAGAVTQRIELGTSVTLLPQHDPIWLAKQVATLDSLTGGRVVLGVGLPWNREQTESHGVTFATRRQRFVEAVAVMRALWTDEQAAFAGEHFNLPPSLAYPKPVQPGGPPILLGGMGPKAYQIMAQCADGWMPISARASMASRLAPIQDAFRAAGRDPATVQLAVTGATTDPDGLANLHREGVGRALLTVWSEESDEILRELDRFADIAEKARAQF